MFRGGGQDWTTLNTPVSDAHRLGILLGIQEGGGREFRPNHDGSSANALPPSLNRAPCS